MSYTLASKERISEMFFLKSEYWPKRKKIKIHACFLSKMVKIGLLVPMQSIINTRIIYGIQGKLKKKHVGLYFVFFLSLNDKN